MENEFCNFEIVDYSEFDEFKGKKKAQRVERVNSKRTTKGKIKLEKKQAKFANQQIKAQNRQATRLAKTALKETGQTNRAQIEATAQGGGEVDGPRNYEKSAAGETNARKFQEIEPKMTELFQSQPTATVEDTTFNVVARKGYEPKMQAYLEDRNYAPDEISDDPFIMTAQVAAQYDADVQEIADREGVSYPEAEELYFSNEISNFDPVTMAFIKAAGQKGIQEIGKAQAKKGKTFLGKKYDPKTGAIIGVADKNPAVDTAATRIIGAGIGGIERQKTDDAILDAAPYILGAAVVLLALGAMLA